MPSPGRLQIVDCDTAVQLVYRVGSRNDDRLEYVLGGGGTSFVEPLSAEFPREHRPHWVLYITDGEAKAPARVLAGQAAWCLLGGWAKKLAGLKNEPRIPTNTPS